MPRRYPIRRSCSPRFRDDAVPTPIEKRLQDAGHRAIPAVNPIRSSAARPRRPYGLPRVSGNSK